MKYVFRGLKLLGLAVIIISAVQLIRIYTEKNKTQQKFTELQDEIVKTTQDTMSQTSSIASVGSESKADSGSGKTITPKFEKLYKNNKDIVGWLKVDDTNIDYPVMQTKSDPEFYLSHDFDKKQSEHGVPFADAACDVSSSDNITVYGHSMRDDTMFSQLNWFTEDVFRQKEHIIHFDTVYEDADWTPIAVFKIAGKDIMGFPYNTITDFTSDKITANDYFSRCKYHAMWYDETVTLNSSDRLLTLSTCEFTLDDGRLVVVARKIK